MLTCVRVLKKKRGVSPLLFFCHVLCLWPGFLSADFCLDVLPLWQKDWESDPFVQTSMASALPEQKKLFVWEDKPYVLKKRAYGGCKEALAWEVSSLLMNNPSCVPSFCCEIAGFWVVVQPKEEFVISSQATNEEKEAVSLFAYWKAHLEAYLLGLGDLVGRNIGIRPDHSLCFFDAECSFHYRIRLSYLYLQTAEIFISQAFDWSQFYAPLDRQTAALLEQYVRSWQEESVQEYALAHQSLLPWMELSTRMVHIQSFAYQAGKSFADFYRDAFPRVFAGLPTLCHIVSLLEGRVVHEGEALVYLAYLAGRYPPFFPGLSALRKWCLAYL